LLRYTLAPLLGAVTGLALCRGVLPLGLQAAGYGNYLALGYYLDRFCWVSVVAMALGGLGVARARHALEAVKAFSLGGLVAGAGLALLGLGGAPRLLALAGLLGWAYGLPAGLLLQAVLSGLPQPAAPPAAADAEPGADQPMAATPDDYSI
jgi:hypothetical protein